MKSQGEIEAAVCDGVSLTYGELNARANRLARHLRRRGVGPDMPVAVCVERSLDLIVALLGVLKAGGAYVPLDPAYPRERLAFLLEDALGTAAAPVLLTHGADPNAADAYFIKGQALVTKSTVDPKTNKLTAPP